MQFRRNIVVNPITHPNELFEVIKPMADICTLPAGYLLYSPGDEKKCFYYLAKGTIRHFILDSLGNEKTLYLLASGWFFGECALVLKQQNCVFAETTSEVVVYRISYKNFQKLTDSSKLFTTIILENAIRKLLILTKEVGLLSLSSSKDRLRECIVSLADTTNCIDGNWYNLRQRYTQNEIGTLIGASRVTVSKMLSELCDEKFIRIVNRDIQLNIFSHDEYKE